MTVEHTRLKRPHAIAEYATSHAIGKCTLSLSFMIIKQKRMVKTCINTAFPLPTTHIQLRKPATLRCRRANSMFGASDDQMRVQRVH